jgi:RNA polymerase sigma-70 factor (ECF subfamily)
MHTPAEALFLRYRSTGQPEPLGELFDLVGPQLLALALHLCNHPADAEDALQQTFAVAIDRAASWDATRPVLPWLAGILGNHCKRIGERRARRREQELPAEPLVLDDGSPLLATERRELVAKLREHIDRLPVEQRQVLLLQLEHGLSPAEVAEVLAVPPGTVRMRLHRAVQTLRGVLPASLVALMVVALPSRGMAAVRGAVLAHAATAGLVGGKLLLKQTLAAALAVLLSVAATLAWVMSPAPANDRDAAVPAATGRVVRADAAMQVATSATEAPPDREIPAERERVVQGPATGSLQVRVFDREDGTPVPLLPFRYRRVEGEQERGLGFAYAHTDASGVARIDGLRPGRWCVEGLVGLTGHATVPEQGVGEAILQNARLLPLMPLRCRAVLADGRPAAGAAIVLGGMALPGCVVIGQAGADGRFTARISSGNVMVGARLPGYAAVPMTNASSRSDGEITLRFAGPEAHLRGRIVDAHGAPIVDALVEIGSWNAWRPYEDAQGEAFLPPAPQSTTTDAAGRFAFAELSPWGMRVQVRARGFAAFEAEFVPRAGATDEVCWQLAPGMVVRGRIVDEGDQPVPAWVALDDAENGPARECGMDGCFEFANVPRGPHRLQASARGFEIVAIDVPDQPVAEILVQLPATPEHRLRLVDSTRRPLVGWAVNLRPRRTSDRFVTDQTGCVAFVTGKLREHALLVAPPGSIDAIFELPLPKHPGADGVLEVTVPDALLGSATITGMVATRDGAPLSEATVELRTGSGLYLARTKTAAGHFTFARVPPGDWRLWVRRPQRTGFDPSRVVDAVLAGEVRDLGVLRAVAEGAIQASLRSRDGQPMKNGALWVFDAAGTEWRVACDQAPTPLPAGRYRYEARALDCCHTIGSIDVRAGETTLLEVRFAAGTERQVSLRVPTESGLDLRRAHCVVRHDDGTVAYDGVHEHHPEDDVGRIALPRLGLAVGTWHVEVTFAAGERFVGTFPVDTLQPTMAPLEVPLMRPH